MAEVLKFHKVLINFYSLLPTSDLHLYSHKETY